MNHPDPLHDGLAPERATAPRSRPAPGPGVDRQDGPLPGNAALARLLGSGGGVDRAATRSQGAGPLDDEIAADINQARGGGSGLDDGTRGDMESHLGVDLSGVRVHTGSQADGLSRSVQADAFTTGSDVFFRDGKYQPGTSDGRRLLAHELTHVVQQSTGAGGPGGRVSHPDDPHEREASAVGDAVASTSPAVAAPASASAPLAVARQEAGMEEEQEEEVARQAAVDRADDAGAEEEQDEPV